LLTEAVERLERDKAVREIAQTNGHLGRKPTDPPTNS